MPDRQPPTHVAGQSLAAIAQAIEDSVHPPVDRWNPDHCGDSEMEILRDGTWLHQGSPITRPAMVRLFATVLRREPDGSHVLVTPVEKLSIEVERTPFRALAMTMEGEGEDRRIAFELDSGDAVIAGADHPISVVEEADGPSPRILVRHGLQAEIARPLYYELAEAALAEGANGIWSDGTFFSLES